MASVVAFLGMLEKGHVTVDDILLLFIYLELGAMVGIELVRDRKSREPAPEETKRVQGEALKRGVIFPTAGLYGNVVRFLVPLTIPDDALLEGIAVLGEAFAAAAK